MDTIGTRFKALRIAAGQDQKSFAAAIGISQGTLSDIESGKCKPSAETLISVCKYCGTSSDWILTGIKGPVEMAAAGKAACLVSAVSEAGGSFPDGKKEYLVEIDGYEKEILDIYREFDHDARMELRMFLKVKLDYLRMKRAEAHRS
jgi:transcriptional regulator with XRE-family HTH domain